MISGMNGIVPATQPFTEDSPMGKNGILCDYEIAGLCFKDDPMINPYVYHYSIENGPSFGCGSYGYDIRLGKDFKKLIHQDGVIDTRSLGNVKYSNYTIFDSESIILFPGDVVLGVSQERFHMPNDVIGLCYNKSTLVRIGIDVKVTPLEPGWKGFLTLEIHNFGPMAVQLHVGDGICQVVFHQGEIPEFNYGNRQTGPGKYQDQENEATPAR